MTKKLAFISCCVLLGFSLCGCALLVGGAAGGAGTAFWMSGKLSEEVNTSYEKTINAAKKALKSLDMAIDKETKLDEVTQIRSKYDDGREVWIDVRPLTQKTSKVEIRVGVKGDEAASTKIFKRIKKYL